MHYPFLGNFLNYTGICYFLIKTLVFLHTILLLRLQLFMKNIFLHFLLLLSFGMFFPKAQEHLFLDSLNKSFSDAKTDKEKALILMKISDYWSYRDTLKAFEELRKSEPYIGQDKILEGN